MKNAQTSPRGRMAPKLSTAAASVALACTGLAAHAETSPYYVGVSQSFAHESNVFRLTDGQAVPATVKRKSDTISSTALIGGFDQPWGRQRLYGSAALRANRFSSNKQLNNDGYSMNLGMDWSTIERISGNVNVGSQRNLRAFDPNEANLGRNVETTSYASITGRIGVVTRLTTEASLSWRKVDYTAAAYRTAEYDQLGGSIGLRYRVGGATTVGVALRTAKANYNNPGDTRRRNDLDLWAEWAPNSISSLYGRVSYGRVNAALNSVPDFSGVTGEVRGTWQPTGKLRLNARLARDTGQETSFASLANTRIASADYSRVSTSLSLGADYALTAKVSMYANAGVTQRDLNNSTFNIFGGNAAINGSDTTSTLALGAKWQAMRSVQLGCEVGHDQRSTSSNLSLPYSNNSFSCYGQLTLQ